jgi:hypothetical protein
MAQKAGMGRAFRGNVLCQLTMIYGPDVAKRFFNGSAVALHQEFFYLDRALSRRTQRIQTFRLWWVPTQRKRAEPLRRFLHLYCKMSCVWSGTKSALGWLVVQR